MGIPTSILVMLFALLFTGGLEFCYSTRSIDSNVSCIQSEREALVKFKQSLIDQSNRLSSWVGEDCCSWNGVGCSKRTGHVVKLDLSNPTSFGYVANYSRTCLGGEINPSLLGLKHLRYVDLSMNYFTGTLPRKLGEFRHLEYLSLSSNSFSGPIPESIGRLSFLRILDISDNQLNGSIPTSLGQLSKLEALYVSNNSLNGMVSELHFAKLTRLNKLGMSSNSLVLNVSSKWVPPSQLQRIGMASCKLGPQFPQWLQTQRNLEKLIIRNASISDTIPDWFENVYSHINYLDVSQNKISGKLPRFQYINGANRYLILNSNKFEGPLPPFPSDVCYINLSDNLLSGEFRLVGDNMPTRLEALTLSSNHLTGGFPTYLCQIKTIVFLDLSNNQLSGRLPQCLGELKHLAVLDLTNNSLHGEIPASLGSLASLTSLHLQKNKFHGKLPMTLQNLSYLELLDLAENVLTDIIPPWIGKLNLNFLSLQSNNFYGDIPPQLCHLRDLQLLNLAQNNVSGSITHCFGNFTGMVVNHKVNHDLVTRYGYQDKLLDPMKGRELEYTRTLPFVTSIDLSNNNIVGEIPEELMDLFGLQHLNIAGNHLKGRIPENIGNLKQLESLDLSRNKLSGSIPPSLSSLSFLSRLNLSFNNLSWRIPMGNQLQTLDDQSIYMGNDGLCGLPLLKSCPGDGDGDHKRVSENKGGDQEFEFLWFYAGIGPGFSVGFLGVCAVLHFNKSWRYAYFHFLDNGYNRLFVAIAIKANWLRRKFHR